MPKQKYEEETPPKRLLREFSELQESFSLPAVFDLRAEDEKLNLWTGLILPDNHPYDKGAFRFEINFPDEYPFKPPKVLIRTKIYHPNIDEQGQVCLAICLVENWKPTIRMEMVFQTLIALFNEPVPENAIRPAVAEEYIKDRKKFLRIAEDFTRKHSERRPDDDEIAAMEKKKLKMIKEKAANKKGR